MGGEQATFPGSGGLGSGAQGGARPSSRQLLQLTPRPNASSLGRKYAKSTGTKWVCLFSYCDVPQWTVKSSLASSGGLARSITRHEDGTTVLPVALLARLNRERFSSTRLFFQ